MTARQLWADGIIAAQHVSEHDLRPLGRDAGLTRLDPGREPGGVAVALGREREVLQPEGDKSPPGLRPNEQLQAARVSEWNPARAGRERRDIRTRRVRA